MNPVSDRAALRILRLDHTRLAAITGAMLELVSAFRGGASPPDPIVLRAMLYYIREYPEQIHHPLEDRYLFAALRKRTDDLDDVLDELECEHIEGAVRLRNLEHALTRYELKGDAVRLNLQTLMEEYVAFASNHRRVEESLILPAAERLLTDSDWARIDAAFEERFDPFGDATFEGETLDSLYRLIANAVPAVDDTRQDG
ncbi:MULTISPECIES: hemerythrin domain-containing protein [unclassified Caballeronia]|uniref:hemerythrin domain-containing protein n=1 Tax=unclassified Caballeronia TaxID=2646786 RepID=UPI0020299CAD|nr:MULTISPECIES: hemerythrin domain-containing protein [unclassified Caballeronia]